MRFQSFSRKRNINTLVTVTVYSYSYYVCANFRGYSIIDYRFGFIVKTYTESLGKLNGLLAVNKQH